MNHIVHLDVHGGIAGDMFAAAMLDLYPDLTEHCRAIVKSVVSTPELELDCVAFTDGLFCGRKYNVGIPKNAASHNDAAHAHRHWRDIRRLIESAEIPDGIRNAAISIFTALAEAEAHCHGVSTDDVSFHEVGALDSIADILIAACIVQSLPNTKWTMSTLPTGSGTVKTAHGLIPVPVPAVVRLLQGYTFIDDAIPGERITPTGAAILKYLNPEQSATKEECQLIRCGIGFGNSILRGTSNILRAVLFEETKPSAAFYDRGKVLAVRFDVDDQTPEDLAVALGNIADLDGVIDVSHATAMGKKGRQTMTVQILAKPASTDAVIEKCFDETTTLGLRWHIENRAVLHREHCMNQSGTRIKVAHRSLGLTAKAEMDDLKVVDGGHKGRQEVRSSEEIRALKVFSRGIEV